MRGLVRIHPLGGIEQLGGTLRADIGLQHIAAAPLRREPEIGKRQTQAQALAHVNDVGVEQHGGATAYRHTLRGGHQGFVEIGNSTRSRLKGVLVPGALFAETGQVHARAEILPGTTQQHAHHGIIAGGGNEGLAQADPHGVIDGVFFLRPVKTYQHAIVVFSANQLRHMLRPCNQA